MYAEMSFAPAFDFSVLQPISPWQEMGAYEALWLERGATFKTISDKFRRIPNARPSDFVPLSRAVELAAKVDLKIRTFTSAKYGVRIHGSGEYPQKIRVAKHPLELLYYQGFWALSEYPSIAVVGTRNPSPEGISRAKKITEGLVSNKIVPVSGLARGIDTVVHETSLKLKAPTIGIIGTPISMSYPRENTRLQEHIATEFLLISQIPVIAYDNMPLAKTRAFFPERNVTMSALTDATVIVEAGESSGTLIQAKAALDQGRPLFILESCFLRRDIRWPAKFEELGAIRVSGIDDIIANTCSIHKNR